MKVVLDTNVVLSTLLFSRGSLTWLRTCWEDGLIIPLINKATLEELQRVLSYPKFQLDSHEISELIDNYLLYAQFVEESLEMPELPHCTDRDDQKFLILAAVGKATVLLTGDKALLNLTGQTSFAIETPQTFYQRREKMRLLKPEDNSS